MWFSVKGKFVATQLWGKRHSAEVVRCKEFKGFKEWAGVCEIVGNCVIGMVRKSKVSFQEFCIT